ncbi:MAG: hypothetical protein ACPG8W_08370 [Candidatus Promineifilaceae bacterium]
MQQRQGIDITHLRAKAAAYNATLPKMTQDPKVATVAEAYELRRVLKMLHNMPNHIYRQCLESMSGLMSRDTLEQVRRMAVRYGADGVGLGWISTGE